MKYEVLGFYQQRAVELGLCSDDLLVLRWFVDFAGTNKMQSMIIDNQIYYWVNYSTVLKELPILKISKQTLYKKHFTNLCNANVLIHKQVKEGGNFSYYCYGINYDTLVYLQTNDPLVKNNDLVSNSTKGCVEMEQTLVSNSTEQRLINNNIHLQDNKEKESIKEKDIKHKYGEYGWIKLTDNQYEKLCKDFSKEYIDLVIEKIDEYIQSNGNKNKYKDWNLIIRKSIRDKWSCLKDIKSTPTEKPTTEYEDIDICYISKYGSTVFDTYPRKKGQKEWTEEEKSKIMQEKEARKWVCLDEE